MAEQKNAAMPRRRTAEERLQRALTQQQTIQRKIDELKKDVDEKSRKARNRGLMLIGIVVEQCLKEGLFHKPQEMGQNWWLGQASRLHEKDRAAYVTFVQLLHG
ncbi:hypothetical protein [Desulfovibrio cuneatus]|uniref:hypothetical protein n=1 Tax=Desulfovibrio cuneatus TaxID=159728 RepID=UPI0004295137|nr:hypothetical protein [Desulfovibrio cuneatus]